jgi:protein involved in polysaccharide export with SLBB domain
LLCFPRITSLFSLHDRCEWVGMKSSRRRSIPTTRFGVYRHVAVLAGTFLLLLTLLGSGGCIERVQKRKVTAHPPISCAGWYPVERYVIQIGDELDVKVFGCPTMDQHQQVRPDGCISVEWMGEVRAAGLTPAELDSIVTTAYCRKLVEPELTVVMRSFQTHKVFVGGKVRRPGEIKLQGGLTALQAIFQAGGHTEEAKLESVILIRSLNKDQRKAFELDLKRTIETGEGDIVLQPYDILAVPPTRVAKLNLFVDKYINRIIPNNFWAGIFSHYDLRPIGDSKIGAILP